ncbi:hypothetical protein N0V90_006777 [Kalmusia sp. IMI 367209]|nr:hypothetical protein N0V90_006777 [Kalmusia sp. IMI 367209]
MPPRRQLPWATKGGGRRTQVKLPPTPAAKKHIPSDIDDDFFDGTVLESARVGKKRPTIFIDTESDAEESEDALPEPTTKCIRSACMDKKSSRDARMPSSSPPPIAADLPPPKTEFMHKGVDKFDLRDDEWMMVEDELLQTAKLFTQHLHLAEYVRLKAKMEEQRKEIAARPVILNAKPSVEGKFKRKAKEQVRDPKKGHQRYEEDLPAQAAPRKDVPSFTSAKPTPARPLSTSRKISNLSASDSDDLDAPKRTTTISSAATSKPCKEGDPAKETVAMLKPVIPSSIRTKLARTNRRDLWHEWDDFASTSQASIADSSPSISSQKAPSHTKLGNLPVAHRSSPTKILHAPALTRTNHSLPTPSKRLGIKPELDDLNTPKQNPLAREAADRLAKRKADRERDDKKKSAKFDDIPTFLF